MEEQPWAFWGIAGLGIVATAAFVVIWRVTSGARINAEPRPRRRQRARRLQR